MQSAMGGGGVQAAWTVFARVDVEAATEGAGRVGSPFVEVARHVEGTLARDTSSMRAGLGHRRGQLIDTGVVKQGPRERLIALEILDHGVTGAHVIAQTGLIALNGLFSLILIVYFSRRVISDLI